MVYGGIVLYCSILDVQEIVVVRVALGGKMWVESLLCCFLPLCSPSSRARSRLDASFGVPLPFYPNVDRPRGILFETFCSDF